MYILFLASHQTSYQSPYFQAGTKLSCTDGMMGSPFAYIQNTYVHGNKPGFSCLKESKERKTREYPISTLPIEFELNEE